MKRLLAIGLVIALLSVGTLAVSTNTAFAQGATGFAQLNGTVRDSTGSVVVDAEVSVRNLNTNRTYTTTSNSAGIYVVPNLSPGPYELRVTYAGFTPYVQSEIQLTVGQSATRDVTLSVKGRGEVVEVTGTQEAIEPTRTEISNVVGTKQIDSLPISGRLFTDFALLTPGVSTGRTSLQSTFTEFEVTRISFAGMRDLSNAVTVDGADNINSATGSQRATPPQEAVQEFRVVNNSFGAEYGRALGGIVNVVTKSGTNEYHGSVYDYFQNDALNARSLLQPEPQAKALRQNQFGFSLGGPIRKDRTFFFLNYEGQRRGESPTYPDVLVNNLDLINKAKVAIGIDPENLNVLKTKDNDYGIVKVDHQINSRNQFSLRYNIEDGRDLNQLVGNTLDGGGLGAPSSGHDLFVRDQSLVGIVTSQLSTKLVNTALFQYARRHYTFPGVTGQPNLDIPNELLIGHNFGVMDAIWETRVQGSDSMSLIKGTHFIQFGADVNEIQNYLLWPGFTPARIVMPGINCLVQFANFANPSANLDENPALGPCPLPPEMHGIPIAFQSAPLGPTVDFTPGVVEVLPTEGWPYAYLPSEAPNFSQDRKHGYYGFFAQDQWKITPKLTLNYGLRWDFERGLGEQVDPRYTGFQPRIGLAWSPDNKTVIRTGFGIFDDRYNLTFFFVTYPQRPAIIPNAEGTAPLRKGAETAVYQLNQYPFIPGLSGVVIPTPAELTKTFLETGLVVATQLTLPSSVGQSTIDPRSEIPYSEQANLEIDREIGRGFTIGAGYIFVSAHHLARSINLNVCPSQGISSGPYPCAAAGPPPPDWPSGKDVFSGVRFPAGLLHHTDNSGNSVYHGAVLQVNKTAGSYLQLNANYTLSRTLDDGTFTTFASHPQDVYKRDLERATSVQDARHRFVASFTLSGPSHGIFKGSLLSNIITIQSPRPFTIYTGFDANNDTNPVTDRVGSAGRNSYKGDELRSWDIRVARSINLDRISEGAKLEVAMDAFNLLNRPNVDEVVSVYGTWNFCGGIPAQYKDAASIAIQRFQATGCPAGGPPIPNPFFGKARTMFNPRQLQFSLKFQF